MTETDMGEKLKKTPIVEAVCEFVFDPSAPWDWTIPGQLFERIKAEFPVRSQLRGITLEMKSDADAPQLPNLRTAPERVQLKRTDESAMVQVGERLLAVNHLRPYPNWENFRELILKVFTDYTAIAAKVPLKRIGLRYINQIETPPAPFGWADLITVTPPLRGPLDRPLLSFYQRYEIVQEEPKGVLIHQTGIMKVKDRDRVMLDLDFASEQVRTLETNADIERWLDQAHARILEAFVASLNPGLYNRMKEGA